jgi:hypothetical protein
VAAGFGGEHESEAQRQGRATGGRNTSKQAEPEYFSGSGVCSKCKKPTAIDKASRCTGVHITMVAARCKNHPCNASNRLSIKKCNLTVWEPPPPQQQQQEEEQPHQQQEVEEQEEAE